MRLRKNTVQDNRHIPRKQVGNPASELVVCVVGVRTCNRRSQGIANQVYDYDDTVGRQAAWPATDYSVRDGRNCCGSCAF